MWGQPIGFIVFQISSLAECKISPFDLPEAKEELIANKKYFNVFIINTDFIISLFLYFSMQITLKMCLNAQPIHRRLAMRNTDKCLLVD